MAAESDDYNNNNSSSSSTEEEEEIKMLRRRISSHPLFGLLLETHLNCLKVGRGIPIGELVLATTTDNKITWSRCLNTLINKQSDYSELDRFMETYCVALGKLKEAMEESEFKSMAFINTMHSQLSDLTLTLTLTPPKPN